MGKFNPSRTPLPSLELLQAAVSSHDGTPQKTVCLQAVLGSQAFQQSNSLLTLALGMDIGGNESTKNEPNGTGSDVFSDLLYHEVQSFVKDQDNSSDALSDPLHPKVQSFLRNQRKVTIALLQRHFNIGFVRAARIMEQLERDGVISDMMKRRNKG